MRDFGRIVSDLNQGLDEFMGTIDRMQKLYRTFQDLKPIWQEMSGMFQPQGTATTSMTRPVRRAAPQRRRKNKVARRGTRKMRRRRRAIDRW